MAKPIECDPHNLDHLADLLVTDLSNGNVTAYCAEAFAETVLAMASAMVEAETAQAAAEAEAKLADTPAAPDPTGSGPSSGADAPAAAKRTRRGGGAKPSAPADTDGDDPRLMAVTPLGEQIDGGGELPED